MNNKKEVLSAIKNAGTVAVWIKVNEYERVSVSISKVEARRIVRVSDPNTDITFVQFKSRLRIGEF